MNELSLIVDTNFFHECKEIEKLNWAILGSFYSINVLVTSRVITELDNHKNSPKPRIKRRALKINKILANIIDNQLEPYVIQETAPRVLLKIENIAVSRQYNHILDDRVIDDMIIATACALRDKYPERQFCLLSGDLGVAAKAFIRITLEEYNDYTEEYNRWFMDTADIFSQLDEKFNKNLSWIGCISIDNQGSIPAENVTMRLTARGKIKIAHYCERNISKNILSKPPSLPFFRVTGVNWDPKIYSAQRNLDNIDYQPDELIEFTCDSLQHQIGLKSYG